MKKTLLTLVAVITLGSLTFAQTNFTPKDMNLLKKDKNFKTAKLDGPSYTNKNLRSAWVGGAFDFYWPGAQVGDEFYIVGSEFNEFTAGSKITKVKFYHVLGDVTFQGGNVVTFTNTSYTIKIYENPTLTPTASGYATNIGTPVYTQTVVLDESTSGANYELQLETPYIVNNNTFWVAVKFDNGIGAMRLGNPGAANQGRYYMYYTSAESGTNIEETEFTQGHMALGISLYLDDETPYEPQSDLKAWLFNNYTDQYLTPITSIILNEGQDLALHPGISNSGPDATNATITGSIKINDTEIGSFNVTESLPVSSNSVSTLNEPFVVTSTELQEMALGNSFEVCFEVTYEGTDPDLTNNTECITVTIEGEATPTTCDLEALFMTSNEDPSPIGATIDIEASDTITLYPGIKNLGNDVANTYATVTFTANDQEVPSIPLYFTNPQQVDLDGLAVNDIHKLYPDPNGGLTLTPLIMDYFNLTGNFELCMEVVYNGTDNDASNNKVCVTVNRAAPAATTCDLQALFMTSNTNPAPIEETEITLEFNEGITLYPGIKNNGPDNANTNATITLTAADTVALINPNPQTLPLNGILDNGETLPLTTTAAGMTITAEQMNQLGLGDTFDICLTVTYEGTDTVENNNTTCVTVTRPTVGIEDNLASEISVYPNPAYDFVTIANAENANIVIINMLGEIVATVNNASSNQTIDISRLATGTYFVKVDGEVFKINVVK